MSTNAQEVPKTNAWKAAVVIAIAGIATSLYSIKHHMEFKVKGHTDASCNINSTISCDAVAASKYSEVFGIPLGVWGLGYFLAMAVLATTVLMNHKTRKEHEPAWFVMTAIGIVSSLALAGISLGLLGQVCIVCVIVYTLTLGQAGVAWSLWGQRKASISFSGKNTTNGLVTAVIAVAVAVLGFTTLKPKAELPAELQDLPGKVDGKVNPLTLAQNAVDIPINKNPYSGLGEDYRRGPDDAKIIIVEFADYMCPACGQTAPVLEELHRQLGSRAMIVFKNFPLSNQCNSGVQGDMHTHSCDIAKLARCAGNRGKFWDYHLLAMSEQTKASKEQAREWGKKIGLTDPEMDECLASKDVLAKIRDDVSLAEKLGVNSTPTIYINGRKYFGERSAPAMRAVIESM